LSSSGGSGGIEKEVQGWERGGRYGRQVLLELNDGRSPKRETRKWLFKLGLWRPRRERVTGGVWKLWREKLVEEAKREKVGKYGRQLGVSVNSGRGDTEAAGPSGRGSGKDVAIEREGESRERQKEVLPEGRGKCGRHLGRGGISGRRYSEIVDAEEPSGRGSGVDVAIDRVGDSVEKMKIGTWNVGSMNKKTLEVAETLGRWGWTFAVCRKPEGEMQELV
jgi:hypothetical protein